MHPGREHRAEMSVKCYRSRHSARPRPDRLYPAAFWRRAGRPLPELWQAPEDNHLELDSVELPRVSFGSSILPLPGY